MILIFVSSFVAGLAYCAAPGAVNAEGIRRGLCRGFRSCMTFQLGSMTGDVLWAIATLGGLAMLQPSPKVQLLLGVGGGVVLVWMAWDILSKVWANAEALTLPCPDKDLLLGSLLTLANPFTFLFWISVGGGLLALDVTVSPWLAVTLIVSAFILASLVWSLLLASLASCGRKFIRPTAFRWIDAGAGVCMAFFGIALCWQTLATLAPLLA